MVIKIGEINVSKQHDENFSIVKALEDAGYIVVCDRIGYKEYHCIISKNEDIK